MTGRSVTGHFVTDRFLSGRFVGVPFYSVLRKRRWIMCVISKKGKPTPEANAVSCPYPPGVGCGCADGGCGELYASLMRRPGGRQKRPYHPLRRPPGH